MHATLVQVDPEPQRKELEEVKEQFRAHNNRWEEKKSDTRHHASNYLVHDPRTESISVWVFSKEIDVKCRTSPFSNHSLVFPNEAKPFEIRFNRPILTARRGKGNPEINIQRYRSRQPLKPEEQTEIDDEISDQLKEDAGSRHDVAIMPQIPSGFGQNRGILFFCGGQGAASVVWSGLAGILDNQGPSDHRCTETEKLDSSAMSFAFQGF